MGIGFDIFKARVGMNLADNVMDSISNAIEKNATESAAREQAEKKQLDENELLKILVFMVGNNIELGRGGKKVIASVLSIVYNEKISLFSIEDKIDEAYSELRSVNPKQFFANISAINSDRKHICLMYIVILLLYIELNNANLLLPAHVYNLYLIKRFFSISRAELAKCYSELGTKLEEDTDDIADTFEELTSDEAIKAIEEENPDFIYKESVPTLCANPKEEIGKIYNGIVQGVDKSFTARFDLADNNPKKAIVAVNSYAKNCKGEEILVFYDDSAFGNGKVGFLLTNKKLYVCNSFEKPQEIDITEISTVSATQKQKIFVNNNITISTTMVNEIAKNLMCDFLQKVIPFAKQIEVQTA